VVLAANAVLSFGYAKNVIMGIWPVCFLAMAVHAAARTWWRDARIGRCSRQWSSSAC
jgi:hypothetical protein